YMAALGKGKVPMHAKGGKGLGKGGAKRHKKRLDSSNMIAKPQLRRLARRAGVKRLSSLSYPEIRTTISTFLENVLRKASGFCENAGRKTINSMDIVCAMKANGSFVAGIL
ncbi:MAG: hypothetical protein MHPSP_001040, partial [Paramarteilia canceri]